jgi:AcrR family transcriptional regulator
MKPPDLMRGEAPRRAPVQRRSLERREAILQAALVRFGQLGYGRATVRGIARRANVATGSVYQFFGSKRQLLLFSMDALLRRLEQVEPPSFGSRGGRVLESLERFLADVFSRERPFLGAYRAWREAALVDGAIAARDRRVRAWSRRRVHGLFEILSCLPGARQGLDLEMLAELWDRFFWDLLADPPVESRRAVHGIARALYHTIFSDPPTGRGDSRPRRG